MLAVDHLKTLHHAYFSAFDPVEFRELLQTRLDVRPDRLVAPSAGMDAMVFEVIQAAERAGWTTDLVRVAYEARPTNAQLAEVYEALGLAAEVQVGQAGTADEQFPPLTTASPLPRCPRRPVPRCRDCPPTPDGHRGPGLPG